MPVLSFNPAYPQRKFAQIPEQRRVGLPTRVPGGVGGGIGLPTANNIKRDRSVGGIVPGGLGGGIIQLPNPTIDRRSPFMLAMQNPFRGGLPTLSMKFRNLQFLNGFGATKYNEGGAGLINWTTNGNGNVRENGGALDYRVSYMAISRGAMKDDTALYESKRFLHPDFSDQATPAKPNQLARSIAQPQQKPPVTNFLSRWVSTATQQNQQKTLPVIPYAALSQG